MTLISDSNKRISGNPLFYHDTANGTVINLTSTAQVLYSGVGGSSYQDINNYNGKLGFKGIPKDIPAAGNYQGDLVNIP